MAADWFHGELQSGEAFASVRLLATRSSDF